MTSSIQNIPRLKGSPLQQRPSRNTSVRLPLLCAVVGIIMWLGAVQMGDAQDPVVPPSWGGMPSGPFPPEWGSMPSGSFPILDPGEGPCDLSAYRGFSEYDGLYPIHDYNPCALNATLSTPMSGFPLKFVRSFVNHSGMRMMINQKVTKTTLRPAVRIVPSSSKAMDTTLQTNLYASISITNFNLQHLKINGATTTNFITLGNPQASSSLQTQLSQGLEVRGVGAFCGDSLLQSASPITLSTSGSAANVTGGRAAFTIEGDPSTYTDASCNGASYLSTTVYANRPFAKGPTNRFAAMEDKISATQLGNVTFVNEMISRAWKEAGSVGNVLRTPTSLTQMPPNRFIFAGSAAEPTISGPSVWKGVVPFLSSKEREYSTYSTAHPVDAHSHTEAPKDLSLLSITDQLSSLRTRNVPTITATTTKSIQCDIAEVAGYTMEHIPGGEGRDGLGVESQCLTFSTVDDAQLACSDEPDCIGISTTLNYYGEIGGVAAREIPLCLHLRTDQIQPVIPFRYPRMFYRRPTKAMRTCVVGTEISGKVAIWVQQSHFYTSTVTIRINNELTAVCGAADTFENNIIGLDGACNTYALCYSGSIPYNSVVHIEASEDLISHGCDTALSTIVEMYEVDAVQQAATTESPVDTLSVNGAKFRSKQVAKTTLLQEHRITVAVQSASKIALEVVQSGYGCNPNSCPAYVIKMCAGTVCQTCGGAAGFYNGNRPGKSDRLSMNMFCGNFLTFNTPFTGTLVITVDTTLMSFRTGDAAAIKFSGKVYAERSDDVDPSRVFPYTRAISNIPMPATFLGVKIPLIDSSGTFDASAVGESMGALPGANTGVVVGPLESKYALFEFPFTDALATVNSGDTRYARLTPSNNVQVCVVDHNSGAKTTCNFFAPLGATKVEIKMAQTDFVDLSNVAGVKFANVTGLTTAIAVATRGTSIIGSSVISCGGANNFGPDAPGKEKCSTFLTCTNNLIFTSALIQRAAASSTSSISIIPPVVVNVDIPASMNSLSCDYTSLVVATFSAPASTEIRECGALEFECPGTYKCIPVSSLCDNIQDCLGGEDESQCINWYPLLPKEYFIVAKDDHMVIQQTTGFAGCLIQAVHYQSPIFTFTSESCMVINSVTSDKVYLGPTQYIATNMSLPAQTLVRLPRGPSQYGRCTHTVHCQGHGSLIIPTGQTSIRDGQACNCKCNPGYLGSTCGVKRTLDESGSLVVAFEITKPFDTYSIRALTIAKALKGSSLLAVKCDQVYIASTNKSRAFVECDVTSESGQETANLQQDSSNFKLVTLDKTAWPVINGRLSKDGHRTLAFISRSGVVNAFVAAPTTPTACTLSPLSINDTSEQVTSVATCNLGSTLTQAGGKSNRIRISTFSSRSAWWITRRADAGTTARHMSTMATEPLLAVRCAAASTPGICIRSTCDFILPYSNTTTSGPIIFDVSFGYDILGTCSGDTIEAKVLSDYGNAPTETEDSVNNETETFTPILIFSGILFLAGIVCGIAAVVFLIGHLHETKEVEERTLKVIGGEGKRDTDRDLVGELMYHKALMASHLVLQHRNKGKILCLKRRIVTVLVTFSFLLSLGGIFAVLAFVTSYSFDSNFSVVYSEFSDDGCSQSPVSSIPESIFVSSTEGRGCNRLQIYGSSYGTVYLRAECKGSAGSYQADLQIGSSEQACLDSSIFTVVSDVCLPVATFFPEATRPTFASISCTTSKLAAEKVAAVVSASTVPTSVTLVNPASPPSNLRNYNLDPTLKQADGTIITPFISGTSILNSSSVGGNIVTSIASIKYAFGPYDGTRMVSQFHTAITTPPLSVYSASTFENDLRPYLFTSPLPTNLQSQLSATTISLSTYPLGFTFNGFATPSTMSLNSPTSTVAMEAQRYYYIRNTAFDMGAWLAPSHEITPETGFSISFYMRATTSTEGFAFAVADVYEHIQTKKNILLERLATMIRNSEPQSNWYKDNYGIYSSFYVNGPGATVSFIYADPEATPGEDTSFSRSSPFNADSYDYTPGTQDDDREAAEAESRALNRLTQIDWNLKELGITRLLNGEWHHVAIVFRAESNRMIAQLMVDGETSYTDKGWAQCVSHVPSRVRHFRSDASMSIADIQYERFWNEGALYTGYFNGALYGLTFTPKVVAQGQYLSEGTEEMRVLDSFPEAQLYGLGISLLVFAGIGVLLLISLSLVEFFDDRSAEERSYDENISKCYYAAMLAAVVASKGELRPIRMSTAMRWAKMSPKRLGLVLPDAINSTSCPTDGIIRILYNSRSIKNSSATNIYSNPSIKDWNDLVEFDRISHAASKRYCVLPPVDEKAADLRLSGGDDYLEMEGGADLSDMQMGDIQGGTDGGEVAGDDGVGQISELKGAVLNLQVKLAQITFDSVQIHQLRAIKLDAIQQHLSPLIAVFQSLFVWSTSMNLPELYDSNFKELLSVFSFDFATFFPQVPLLLVLLPTLLVLALIGVGLVIYLSMEDNKRFETNLIRYVWKRDAIEGGEELNVMQEQFDEGTKDVISNMKCVPAGDLHYHCLSLHDSHKMDVLRRKRPPQTEEELRLKSNGRIEVTSLEKPGATLTASYTNSAKEPQNVSWTKMISAPAKNKSSRSEDDEDQMPAFIESLKKENPHDDNGCCGKTVVENDKRKAKMLEVKVVGIHCWRHTSRLLSSQTQTDIWPFTCPPTCQMSIGGKKCGQHSGEMYTCGKQYEDQFGVKRVCNFALCTQHCRMSIFQTLASKVWGIVSRITESGFGWLLCVILVTLANIAYTPFLKTSFMILACHPYYQCEFKYCWRNPDQRYVLAVYLSIVVVVFFGVGLPLSQFLMLMYRKTIMEPFFRAKEYAGRYLSNKKSIFQKRSRVADDEWERFVSTDPTALASMYDAGYYHWLYLAPLLTLWKAIALIPAVFSEPGGFPQRIGIALVELFMGVFLFSTKGQMDMIVNISFRLGSIHQLIILGLDNLQIVASHKNQDKSVYEQMMVATTATYVLICLGILLSTVLLPVLQNSIDKHAVKKFLTKQGCVFTQGTGLYLDPLSIAANHEAIVAPDVGSCARKYLLDPSDPPEYERGLLSTPHPGALGLESDDMELLDMDELKLATSINGNIISSKNNNKRQATAAKKVAADRKNDASTPTTSPVEASIPPPPLALSDTSSVRSDDLADILAGAEGLSPEASIEL